MKAEHWSVGRLVGQVADRMAVEPRMDIGRVGDLYLSRWTLLGRRIGRPGSRAVFLHRFMRSDHHDLHDHPWPFVSVVLAGGYWEHTPADLANPAGPTKRRWYGPGRVLVRPAEWRHRVELPPGREAWTVVIRGPKSRSWGFYCPAGYVDWRTYTGRLDAGNPGCGAE